MSEEVELQEELEVDCFVHRFGQVESHPKQLLSVTGWQHCFLKKSLCS